MTETDFLRGALLESLARLDDLDVQLRAERDRLRVREAEDDVLRSSPTCRELEDALVKAWQEHVDLRDAYRASREPLR